MDNLRPSGGFSLLFIKSLYIIKLGKIQIQSPDKGGCAVKKRLSLLLLPLITLLLEILPYGAVCNFARPATDGSIGHFRELYSYFDLTPFGYANFAPLITALITCVIIILMIIYCITGNQKLANAVKSTLLICSAISLGPLLFGFRFFSVVGALITVTLIGEFLLLRYTLRLQKDAE